MSSICDKEGAEASRCAQNKTVKVLACKRPAKADVRADTERSKQGKGGMAAFCLNAFPRLQHMRADRGDGGIAQADTIRTHALTQAA